eukprot:CAMPEP_0201610604 /NCGR_PEP_ID=MMETSP0492-20130828/17297_1 /ASSEMBLY_ACC=CAM_ASM_000837 /TAXON_ID=420259 /ORGANISM="Thalassiosira gravida, Strain GMp14c1" /LENGTH=188 /DNA_ID=CAMNT_0048076475 /DNA_START=120 /DNA_END=683 /DNA_ORIENTATION=-
MNKAIASWDNDYARHARAIALLHASHSDQQQRKQWNDQQQSSSDPVQNGLKRLSSHLYYLESQSSMSPAEFSRRRTLLEGLKGQLSSITEGGMSVYAASSAVGGGGGGHGGSSSGVSAALRQQDDMIDGLAEGVDGIKKRTKSINEQIYSQIGRVDEIDENVELAKQELEDVTRRSVRFRKENRKSVW